MKSRLIKKCIAYLLAFIMTLGIAPTPVLADMRQTIRNTPEQNQTILDMLQNFDGSLEQADELLRSFGLLDADGNLNINQRIYLNGIYYTLDEITEIINRRGTDLSQIAWVDGTPVALGDLKTMIEIEEEIARIRDILLSDIPFTAEHAPYLEELLRQMATTGINFNAAAPPVTQNIPAVSLNRESLRLNFVNTGSYVSGGGYRHEASTRRDEAPLLLSRGSGIDPTETISFQVRMIGGPRQTYWWQSPSSVFAEIEHRNMDICYFGNPFAGTSNENRSHIEFTAASGTGAPRADGVEMIWPGSVETLRMDYVLSILWEDARLWRGARAYYIELFDADGFVFPNGLDRITIPVYIDFTETQFSTTYNSNTVRSTSFYGEDRYFPEWPLPPMTSPNMENARRITHGDNAHAVIELATVIELLYDGGFIRHEGIGSIFGWNWTGRTNYEIANAGSREFVVPAFEGLSFPGVSATEVYFPPDSWFLYDGMFPSHSFYHSTTTQARPLPEITVHARGVDKMPTALSLGEIRPINVHHTPFAGRYSDTNNPPVIARTSSHTMRMLNDGTRPYVRNVTIPTGEFYPGQIVPIMVEFSRAVNGIDARLEINGGTGGIVINDEQFFGPTLNAVRHPLGVGNQYSRVHMFEYVVGPTDGSTFRVTEIFGARDMFGNEMLAEDGVSQGAWRNNVDTHIEANIRLRSFLMADAVQGISLDRHIVTNICVLTGEADIAVALDVNQHPTYRTFIGLLGQDVHGNFPAPFHLRVTNVADPNSVTLFPLYLYAEDGGNHLYVYGTISGMPLAVNQTDDVYIVEIIAIDPRLPEEERRESVVFGTYTSFLVEYRYFPAIIIPESVRTIIADRNQPAQVRWFTRPGAFAPEAGGDFTIEIFRGFHDIDPLDAAFGTMQPIYTSFADLDSLHYTVPENIFDTLSFNDVPTYTARVSAMYQGNEAAAIAHVVVVPVRARVNIPRPANTSMLDTQAYTVNWTIAPFMEGSTQAELTIHRVSTINGQDVTELVHAADISNSGYGSFALDFARVNGLRNLYMINIQARNVDRETDPGNPFYSPWNTDSLVLRVYNADALSLSYRDRTPMPNTITLSNIPTVQGLTLQDVSGQTQMTTPEILRLRENLALMEFVGINFDDHAWNMLHDRIDWDTSDDSVVSVNFRQGAIYENLSRFGDMLFLPETVMGLSGLQDGYAVVTATHAATGMSDSVTVNVETMRDQLFIIQASPAIRTSLRYMPVGSNVYRQVWTNDTGTIVLYEPEGIAGNIYMRGENDEGVWLGTLHLDNVLTGERDWTLLQLYPLNTVFMRLTARTDIFLRRPDGTPLTGNVTVRGGVYINGGYAQDALLGTSPNSVDMGSGKSPRTFTIGPGGRLSIYMDSTQFWSEELGHNSNRQLIPADRLLYIFEISEIAGDTLRPVLVYVNGSMSPRQIVRGGESIVGLEHAVGGKGPFVAAQRVEYPGFRRPSADVLHFTGEIGPDETYRHIELVTTALIWGTEFEGDMGGHRIDITDEFGFMPTAQTSYNDSYPFSSIPLVRSRLELSEDSMTASGWVTPATRVGLRSRLSYEQTVISDIPTGFRVLDMNTFPHIQENPDVLNAIDDLIESIQTPGPSGSSGMQTSRNSFMRRALSIMGDFDSGQGDPPFRIAITPTENNPAVFNALIWVGHEGVEMKDIEFDDSGFSWNYNFLESDVPNVASDIKEFFVGDRKNRANTFSDISDALSGAKKSKGPDISVTFTGFYTAEIRFNFDTGAWEIFTTGGGFTAGIGLEFKWSMSKLVGPVPVAVSLTLGGALMFEFETAVRHSEIPGYEWHPDVVASRVNDYLTTLRINAYVKAFAGIGFDKSVVALKVGIFGELTIDSVNRWLSRTYLADESQRQINGQGLRVTGEAGIRFVARLLFLSFTHTFVSVGFTYDRVFNQWNYINDYWNNTGTGLPRGINPAAGAMPMSQGLELIESTATLVSRDYLHQFARSWGSPAGRFMPLVLDNPNRLEQLQSNAYPESRPVITDDGQLLLYLFDQNSDDIRDTRVFATAMNASGAYPEGREIAAPAGFTGYGDMLLRLAGNQNFAAAAWVRMSTYLPYTNAGDAVSIEQQSLLMNATEVVASIYSNGSWASTRITDSQTPNLAPVVATNGTNRAIVAWRSVFASDNENILDFDVQDQILYRIFENGTWGDTIVLYNGTSGSVMGIEAAMLPDGTAMVAYTLDRSHGSGDAAYFEMAYSIVAADGQPEASWIITSDDSINENPQVAAVNFGTTATPDYRFILGWHSVYEGLGDIRLVAINSQGIVSNSFIDAISHVAANVSIAGNFRFASNGTLGGLSIVWAETYDLIGESDALLATNDVLRAVKFTENGISAPLEVAQMPPRTQIDHFNVYAVSPTEVRAVIQATEYKEIDLDDPTTFIATYFDDFDYYTNEYVRHYVFVPNYETKLFTATAHYRNSAELLSVLSEHSNVAPNSYVSVRFDLFNAGYGVINRADIQLGSQTFTFNNLEIMPNESLGLIAHYLVGNTVENLPYTVTAYFGNTAATTLMGTKMLDFPDVGISSIEVIRE
ncbi:MAG: hypothetical protein FWC93_03760, partial [Defluviitaleaceae bacterium]|nr:hypothetical protein [Defluviitaleaceae bacterium]